MNPMDIYAGQLEWARKNINNNLDFIPDDKLTWKPAPEAKSVMEIVKHMTGTINMMTSGLNGTQPGQLPTASNREEAKALVSQVVDAHLAKLRSLTPQELEGKVALPIGEFPMAVAAGLPVVEIINHHGQITYIEELLGDAESHLLF